MERRPATPEEARALANPLRLRILRLCLDHAQTNEQLAARLGRDAGSVLHHVRVLVSTGFLAPEPDRRGARGATEHPYRATRKSWTLDVGDQVSGTLALVDAFRHELAELPDSDVQTLSRLGVRLGPEALATFDARIRQLIDDLVAADDPAGQPFGFLVGMHRRHDLPGDAAVKPTPTRSTRRRKATPPPA